jgi:hypothetical protein
LGDEIKKDAMEGEVTRMGDEKCFYFEKPERKRHLGRPRLRGRIILRWILKKCLWTGFVWLRVGAIGGLL